MRVIGEFAITERADNSDARIACVAYLFFFKSVPALLLRARFWFARGSCGMSSYGFA